MSIGRIKITQKKYRLPKKLSIVAPELVYGAQTLTFNFISSTGHTFVLNFPDNLIWTFDSNTGHMFVEGVDTDRYLNFSYRGSDGHITEEI